MSENGLQAVSGGRQDDRDRGDAGMSGTKMRVRAVSLFVLIAVVGAACGNSDDDKSTTNTTGSSSGTTAAPGDFTTNVPVDAPGVSDTEIKVASITSKTNPLGGNYGSLNDGIKAYFDMVNADGGMYGRDLKLANEHDDQLGNNTQEAEALVSQDGAYAAFVASLLFTGYKTLAEAGIPTFGWNINAEWTGPESFFPNNGALCFGCEGHIVPWLAREVGAKRVGVYGYSVPQSKECLDGNVKSFDAFSDESGAEIVAKDSSLSFGQLDFSAQVADMKDKNVDFVTTCMDANGVFSLIKEIERQGLNDKITFHHPNLYDAEFVEKNAGLFEGDYVIPQFLGFEHKPATAAQQEFFDYAEAHDVTVNELSTQGWIAATQFVDALKAAGPEFTWANLISAWNKQTAYDAAGWITPIDWTKQHKDPSTNEANQGAWECANFVQVKDGKFTPVFNEGGAKPWVCFDGTLKPGEWEEPVNVSFAGDEPISYEDAVADAGTTTTTSG